MRHTSPARPSPLHVVSRAPYRPTLPPRPPRGRVPPYVIGLALSGVGFALSLLALALSLGLI